VAPESAPSILGKFGGVTLKSTVPLSLPRVRRASRTARSSDDRFGSLDEAGAAGELPDGAGGISGAIGFCGLSGSRSRVMIRASVAFSSFTGSLVDGGDHEASFGRSLAGGLTICGVRSTGGVSSFHANRLPQVGHRPELSSASPRSV